MKKLNKHQLEFNPVWEYVQDNLDDVNIISSELLHLLDFKKGNFFTLLPNDANLEEIYHFKYGGILPQFPVEKNLINGHWSSFSWVPDIEKELSQLIFNEIDLKLYLSCVMDKFNGYPKNRYSIHCEDNYSLFFGDEIYLKIDKNNLSIELITKCLKASNTLWHSLCVFTKADLSGMSKMLDLETIRGICKRTELVMVFAYDGEGYVFWEKNLTSPEKGFFEEKND